MTFYAAARIKRQGFSARVLLTILLMAFLLAGLAFRSSGVINPMERLGGGSGAASSSAIEGAAALKGAYDAYKFAHGGMDSALAKAAANPVAANGGPSSAAFAISVSVGVSESRQDSQSSQTQVRGTSVQAKDISISATQGDLTATAAKLQADTIALNAAQNLNLIAGTNHEQNSSTNSSSSMGAGVTIGFGQQSGISFQLSAAQAAGKANGSETVYDNTQVTAAKRLTTKSGKDTNLIGAQLAANTVKMEVGTSGKGDLNIQTLQDKSSFESQQSSSGFSLSLCIPPLCAGAPVTGSISQSQQSIDHNYQSAVGQSGIAAGTGGFDINVAGNTDLQGAAITSSAAKEQNTLQTQTLSASDLTNRQSTSSHSMSVSAGTGMSAMAAAATNALSNLTGNADLPKNMSEQSSTLSVISPAVISITGNDTQGKTTSEQVASTLTSRDDATANQTLTNTLTLQQAAQLEQQQKTAQQNQQAANLVGAVMANSIGDLAQKQGWTEGSAQKTLLHGLSGAIQASIAGGNIGAGFASAALNEQLTPVMDQYLKSQGITPDKPEYADLMKAGSTLVGAASGALASGGNLKDAAVGGNLALVNTTENFLKHDQAKAMVNAFANCKAKAGGCSTEEVNAISQAFINVSNANIDAVNVCIKAGDTTCVTKLETDAATAQEVDAAIPFGYASISTDFQGRQNNVNLYDSVKGTSSLFGSDVQQAAEVANFRSTSCKGISTSACDTLVQQAMDYRMARVGILMAVGGVPPMVANGLRTLTLPKATTSAGAYSVKPHMPVRDEDLANVYSRQIGGQPLGRAIATYDMVNNKGPLPANLGGTFAGGKYTEIVLTQDTVLYRAGSKDAPLGQFFSTEVPEGVIKTRIDKAVLPSWPGGGTSPIDTAFAVKIPAGTKVYVGVTGAQNGFYVGGTPQVVVPTPWKLSGVEAKVLGELK